MKPHTKNCLKQLLTLLMICGSRIYAQQVHIDLDKKSVFIQLEVSKGVIKLDQLPDTMIVIFPDEKPSATTLLFNDEKSKIKGQDNQLKSAAFSVGFQSADTNSVRIFLSDLQHGMIKLIFKENFLIGINNRMLSEPKAIVLKDGKPIIAFKTSKESTTKSKNEWDGEFSNQVIIPLSEEAIKTALLKIKPACGCDDDLSVHGQANDTVDHDKCLEDPLPSEFNERYYLPCEHLSKSKSGYAMSHSFEVLIDRRPGASKPVTYLKVIKDENGAFEYYEVLKRFTPSVERDIVVRVIGHSDSLYKFVNSETQDFMDYADKVSDLFSVSETETTENTQSSPEVGGEEKPDTNPLSDNSIDSLNMFIQGFNKQAQLKEKLRYYNDFADLSLSDRSINNLSKQKGLDTIMESLYDDLMILNESIKAQLDSNKAEIEKLKKKIKEYEDQINTYIESELPDLVSDQKANLSAMLFYLQDLNFKIGQHRTTEMQVESCIKKLSEFALEEMGVAMSADPGELEARLRNAVYNPLGKKYMADFKTIIGQIKSEYNKVVSRTNKYRIYTCQLTTPNADALGLELQTKSGKTEYSNNFRTQLGFKIDFSSGLIYSGLSRPQYELVNQNIRFKETRDSVAADGTVISTYTGNVVDSTGQVIRSTDSGLFNAGFLIHAYTRSGRATNLALTTGTVVSESSVQVMLGGSLLFAARGEYRIALSAGCVWGKQRSLNNDLSRYEWSAENNSVFNSVHDIKPFYKGDGNINSGVVEKFSPSYFFAITMNFGSVTIK